jgi:hypothetical protein
MTPSERITVALIPRVVAELHRLQERTNLSKTDLVNRAITLYEFMDAQADGSHEFIIRDKNTRETQILVLDWRPAAGKNPED